MMSEPHQPTRREFLASAGRAGLVVSAVSALGGLPAVAGEPSAVGVPLGKAKHCIFLWLGGGASQIDTWDPKQLGDPNKKIAGSAYPAIPSAIKDAQVTEHLRRSAPLLDRAVLVRSVWHDVIDEHAAAVNRMHTGRPTADTVVYPSIGSVVAKELGPGGEGVPPYVVMGYPNVTRGPGFLGPKHGYVYLLDTDAGPNGLTPPGVGADRQRRREQLLAKLRDGYVARHESDEAIRDYAATGAEGFKLAGKEFMSVFDLAQEPAALRESYGSEFGQRCLLARRLVERGVRFVEVSHNLNFLNGTGWDTHNEGQQQQHALIDELDRAFSALLGDLEQKKLLDQTLIVISTEFGRPGGFDARGGRGHQGSTFSVVLAGGGLRTGRVVGRTDELSAKPVERPVSVPDLFATVYAGLGIDPTKNLRAGDRPVPITDGGKPIAELFG